MPPNSGTEVDGAPMSCPMRQSKRCFDLGAASGAPDGPLGWTAQPFAVVSDQVILDDRRGIDEFHGEAAFSPPLQRRRVRFDRIIPVDVLELSGRRVAREPFFRPLADLIKQAFEIRDGIP